MIQSPLNYTGGKYKLLPQILPLFPKDIDVFVDLFCGGCNVGVNVESNRVIYNDSKFANSSEEKSNFSTEAAASIFSKTVSFIPAPPRQSRTWQKRVRQTVLEAGGSAFALVRSETPRVAGTPCTALRRNCLCGSRSRRGL